MIDFGEKIVMVVSTATYSTVGIGQNVCEPIP